MLSKFLDPKNDIAFKKIFGTAKNQDILIHFLNDMLVFKTKQLITKVTFLKTIQDPELIAKKTSIVDVMCSDDIGNQYIVEMQVAEREDFVKRAQYYAAKAYSSQLKVGEKYSKLKEIIFLAITNFTMFPDKQEFKSDHVILDRITNEHNLKDFSFTFLELPKFKKNKQNLTTILDKWLYFFKHAEETSERDLQEIIGNDKIIQRAYAELDKFGWSDQELLDYDAVIKRDMDHQALLDKKYNDGLAAGQAESKKEILRIMLAEGIDLNLISKITGLTPEEIE